jgi:hypothetical protein
MRYHGYRNGGDGAQRNDETIVPHDLETTDPGTSFVNSILRGIE